MRAGFCSKLQAGRPGGQQNPLPTSPGERYWPPLRAYVALGGCFTTFPQDALSSVQFYDPIIGDHRASIFLLLLLLLLLPLHVVVRAIIFALKLHWTEQYRLLVVATTTTMTTTIKATMQLLVHPHHAEYQNGG